MKKWKIIFSVLLSGCAAIDEQRDSLDEKIGALLILGFEGKNQSDDSVQIIKSLSQRGAIAGTILFRHNIENPNQLKKLTDFLKSPGFMIAVDQEGGKVQRLSSKNGFEDFPSALEMSKKSIKDAEVAYSKMAKLLKMYNINVAYGPVVDIDYAPSSPVIGELERSYGADVKTVVKYAKIYASTMEKEGILAVLKHFPGHGSVQGDTHEGLVDVTKTWREIELEPYKLMLADKSLHNLMVMTAHITHQKLDPNFPGTFSKSIMFDILRKGMKFEGPIVTDDLHMGAILKNYTIEESAERAIKAGATFLLYSNNPLAAKSYDNFKISYEIPAQIKIHFKKKIREGDKSLEQAIDIAYRSSIKIRANLK